MLRTRFLPYALTAVLTLATACGGDDDSTEPSGDTPSQAEALSMVEALSAISSIGFAGDVNNSDPGLALQSYTYSNSADCPNGGTTSLTGNYTIVSQTQTAYTFDYNVTQTYNGCKATGGGKVYTFNGEGVTTTAHYVYNTSPLSYTITVHEAGNIGWAGNGKGGTCAINLNLNLSYNNTGTYNYTYTGTYCGVAING